LDAVTVSVPPGWESQSVDGIFVSDLISDILVSDGEHTLLITSLLSEQVIRTADVIGAAGVVLVNRAAIPESLCHAAAKQGLPLFHTPLPKFEACVRLGHIMESA
jgi:hypothetical protein